MNPRKERMPFGSVSALGGLLATAEAQQTYAEAQAAARISGIYGLAPSFRLQNASVTTAKLSKEEIIPIKQLAVGSVTAKEKGKYEFIKEIYRRAQRHLVHTWRYFLS